MDELDRWFRHGLGWWLLVGALAGWILFGGVRGVWRRWEAKRRRRAFEEREERRWQGYRRDPASVHRIECGG